MSLTKYNKKRRFNETPEPEGEAVTTEEPLRFVVQKHAASHLHYDFRLEIRGTLKSWAVPKGPSLNPADKRLAMMVEDHPFDYRTFEGIIPEGNYGGGTVIVWDEGTYEPLEPIGTTKEAHEMQLMSMLHKGDLKVVLRGKKLKGAYALVKMRSTKQENAWLLIKKEDKYASEVDVTTKTKSVVSKLTIEQMSAKHGVDTPRSEAKKSTVKKTAAKKTAVKKTAAKKSKKKV